jgi:hypothetical protein
VTPALNYAANCKAELHARRARRPRSDAVERAIGLVAPGTEFTPRVNQLDSRSEQDVYGQHLRITPKLDLFNATNSDQYTAVASTQFGARHTVSRR